MMKSQISSTKLQINLKSQYSMTKTFTKIAARRDIKSGEQGMPLGAMADGSFVWSASGGLGHAQRRRLRRVLGFVWDLVFGAWNFHNFC